MKKPDIFDPSKMYVFNNWSDEDFVFKYADPNFRFIPNPDFTDKENKRLFQQTYDKSYFVTKTVKAGSIIEVQEWLAFLMCKHFVDREFVKMVENKYGSLKRDRNGGEKNEKAESEMLNINNPSVREEMEDKTIRPISSTEESPVISQLREQIRAEEIEKMKKLATAELESLPQEKVDEIVKRGPGRPRKEFAGVNEAPLN